MFRSLLLSALIFSALQLSAQDGKSKIIFGLGAAIHKSSLLSAYGDQPHFSDPDYVFIRHIEKSGVRAHMNIYYLLTPKISLHLAPGAYLQTTKINFHQTEGINATVELFPTAISLPLSLEYSPEQFFKGPRFFAGMEYQQLLGPRQDMYLSLYDYNLLAHVGLAYPFNFKKIQWVPRLTVSKGLENIKKFDSAGTLNNLVNVLKVNIVQFGINVIFHNSQ